MRGAAMRWLDASDLVILLLGAALLAGICLI